ncbi:hypothetical protein PAHAL_2G174900 [Panicum hallii]|uniref:Uncharacterized protein n=1 Tax=Panicum hallii TaxID=206008 RepID=A0A2T8KPD7_9POAL|nr:hypothetical protein PAHAL_2G174900 [Panicum hallii]
MVFPVLPTVADLSKKRKNKSFSSTGEKKQKNTSDTSTAEASDPAVRGFATGSNQLDLLAITYPYRSSEQHMADKSTRQQ